MPNSIINLGFGLREFPVKMCRKAAGAPKVHSNHVLTCLVSLPRLWLCSAEVGVFMHACEGEAVCKLTNPKVRATLPALFTQCGAKMPGGSFGKCDIQQLKRDVVWWFG